MAEWVRLCGIEEAPSAGEVQEIAAGETALCLANIDGTFHVLDNLCPHRQGPLGQGWIEGQAVVCPWHAWAFDCRTGVAEEPERAEVRVYPVKADGVALLVDLA